MMYIRAANCMHLDGRNKCRFKGSAAYREYPRLRKWLGWLIGRPICVFVPRPWDPDENIRKVECEEKIPFPRPEFDWAALQRLRKGSGY